MQMQCMERETEQNSYENFFNEPIRLTEDFRQDYLRIGGSRWEAGRGRDRRWPPPPGPATSGSSAASVGPGRLAAQSRS
jgi:hypothetical protein